MSERFQVLDGWRGISISFVLAGHLLPLGPKIWQMNGAIATTGMALFFILSGFLIANILIKNQDVISFLVRRIMRIFPLAWLVIGITFIFKGATTHQWFSNLFFYANWPPMGIVEITSHFWSLCVEVQFYLFIAILVSLIKKRAFYLIPILCLFITLFRIYHNIEIAINTYYRIDEILAGCILAQIYHSRHRNLRKIIGFWNPLLLLALLLLSAHPKFGMIRFFRPYFAMLLVGSTLFTNKKGKFEVLLKSSPLYYIASISYALYIFHGVLADTWFGEGDRLIKYLKRPLLFGVTFILAHFSTKYFEKYWQDIGKRITVARSEL
ncbi:acyltransferase [uncultured Desulfosarcina sp.]|uniref:acyltransferase family protein n=1 Tax=uncultured Desulfosarcina sp. TaxID=218289 RepID=UPI0029C99153|nr:acyltransferase [uncultured Desulfosarcina sp.]